jgi:hypothetical protein
MNAAAQLAEALSDRLVRFRGLAARLDPAGDPARAYADGLYVRPPQGAGSRIAAELEVLPTSSHLLIGGVGAGKTTELLNVQSQLNRVGDTRALYIDVTKHHDIAQIADGVLTMQVGLALEASMSAVKGSDEAKTLRDCRMRLLLMAIESYAGAEVLVSERFADEGDIAEEDYLSLRQVPGTPKPPEQVAEVVHSALVPTRQLLDMLRPKTKHVIVLLDGLDRITDMGAFEQVVEHDVKALVALGIGVVLVGPLRSLYGIDRTIEQHFARLHYQPWVDPSSDLSAQGFLGEIMRKRLPTDAIDDPGLEALVRASGGVVRDLVALAQLACLEAYLDGPDQIGSAQVEAAIDSFGRQHLQGLRADELEVLQRVRTKGTFVQTSEDDLALLMTRRVLEYRNGSRHRYCVHPTIDRFLKELAGEPA